MIKPALYVWENKGADQLCSKHAVDQCICFRCIDSTIPLLPKSWVVQWLSGGASDLGARGWGFETYRPLVVLVIPRKWWLHPDMTEKLLTGRLSLNLNKQTNKLPKSKILSF